MSSDIRRKCLPKGYRHAFIIRHPILVFSSFRFAAFKASQQNGYLKYNEDIGSFDLRNYADGFEVTTTFKDHHDLWCYIRKNIDPSPMVISTADLLQNPAKILPKYCEAMGFPYSDSLLNWDASPDICKAWKWPTVAEFSNPAFLGSSLTSTHFTPPQTVPAWDQLTDDVRELSQNAMPYYEDMLKHRLII